MTIQRHHNVIHRHAQLFSGGADDTQVRLMWHQPVERGAFKVICFKRLIDNVRKLGHRHLEHLVTRHGQVDGAVRINAIGVRQR